MDINEIIRYRRLDLGLTLRDVADALGVSEGTVSRYESRDIMNMGIDKIENLSRVLRCSPGYLMGWEDSPTLAISEEEEALIRAYRSADPVSQRHVRLLLGIE